MGHESDISNNNYKIKYSLLQMIFQYLFSNYEKNISLVYETVAGKI